MQKKEYNILIIGAGLIGSSTAMHLANLGVKGIAVVDADLAGRLSSSELNAGGARATWDQAINVELSRASIEYMRKEQDKFGFRPCGYLWMYNQEQWSSGKNRVVEMKRRHNIDVEILSVAELQKRVPFIDKTEDLAGASFSPLDGLFNPNLLKNFMRDEARAKGVEFLDGHPVISSKLTIKTHNIKKNLNILAGKAVVNCAGPWASRIASLLGYKTPVYAVRRQVSIFDCKEIAMNNYGMMVDPSGVYFHPEATNILGGYADHSEESEKSPGYF